MTYGIWTALPLMALLSGACVPQGKYDAALKDAQTAHSDSQRCAADVAALHVAGRPAERSDRRSSGARRRARPGARRTLRRLVHDMQAKLDGATAENEQLRKELTRLGKNADALLAEKGSLAGALADAKARLEELRKAQAAAEARAALFKQLALKFHKMIDSGQLKVVLRNGRMVLAAGRTTSSSTRARRTSSPRGRTRWLKWRAILTTITDRHFQVAGDTDNVPIQTGHFPSNWELSTRRADEVVHFLIAQGMHPEVLSAAGYGEFDPVASNDTPDGRAKNRRTEITLEPNINELVAIPTTP